MICKIRTMSSKIAMCSISNKISLKPNFFSEATQFYQDNQKL